MLDLFEALGDLFQNQCKAQGLEIKDHEGKYSRTFQKWSRKLHEAGIGREDMRRGINKLEQLKRDAARTGGEVWPPDYATFIEHCKKREQAAYKSWEGLPKPTLSNEEKKDRMKALRGKIGL